MMSVLTALTLVEPELRLECMDAYIPSPPPRIDPFFRSNITNSLDIVPNPAVKELPTGSKWGC